MIELVVVTLNPENTSKCQALHVLLLYTLFKSKYVRPTRWTLAESSDYGVPSPIGLLHTADRVVRLETRRLWRVQYSIDAI